MVYQLEISERAEKNLAEIYKYIGVESSDTAARWAERLHDAIATLRQMPLSGAVTHENPLTRQLVFGNKPHFYRIIYRVRERTHQVTIVHIAHGRRTR